MAGPFDFLFGGGEPQQQQPPSTMSNLPQFMPQRGAAQSGTIMGTVDTLMGVPTQQQLEAGMAEKRFRETNAAGASIINRMQELKAENPTMPKAMLQQRLFNDPVFLKNALSMPSKDIFDTIARVNEGLYGEDKFQAVGPDTSLVQTNEATGMKPREVYRSPKTFKPGDIKIARSYKGDDPYLAQNGLTGLDPAGRYEVKTSLRPDGSEYVSDINAIGGNGVTVNMGDQAEMADIKSRLESRNKLVEREKAVLSAVRAADRIEQLIDETGASGIGPLGFINRFGQAFVEQAQSAAAQMGVIMDPAAYADKFKSFKGLDKLGPNAAAAQSNIMALAYTIARANNGGGQITKKDVDQSLEIIGANFGSTKQLKAAMREMVGSAIQGYDDAVMLDEPLSKSPNGKMSIQMPRRMSETLREVGLDRYVKKPRAGAPGATGEPTRATGSQIAPGTIFTTPNGTFRFKGGANVPANYERVQ